MFIAKRRGVLDSRNSKRKSETLPDQALTPRQIMEKYLRGIPVNVIQRDAVFMDQEDVDYEQLARMEFDEKFAYAAELRERAANISQQLAAEKKANDELVKKKAEAKLKAAWEKEHAKKAGSSIVGT